MDMISDFRPLNYSFQEKEFLSLVAQASRLRYFELFFLKRRRDARAPSWCSV